MDSDWFHFLTNFWYMVCYTTFLHSNTSETNKSQSQFTIQLKMVKFCWNFLSNSLNGENKVASPFFSSIRLHSQSLIFIRLLFSNCAVSPAIVRLSAVLLTSFLCGLLARRYFWLLVLLLASCLVARLKTLLMLQWLESYYWNSRHQFFYKTTFVITTYTLEESSDGGDAIAHIVLFVI